jgi:hypothetical protein
MKLLVRITTIFLLIVCSYSYGALPLPTPSNVSFKFIKIFYHKCSKQSLKAKCKKDIRRHIISACDVRDEQMHKDNFRCLVKCFKDLDDKTIDWVFIIRMLKIIANELESITHRTDLYGKIAAEKIEQLVAFEESFIQWVPQGINIPEIERLVPDEPLLFAPSDGVPTVEEEDEDWTLEDISCDEENDREGLK